MSSTRPDRGTNRPRRYAFRLAAALLVPALFFASVEVVLRVCGTGYPAGFLEPSAEKAGYLRDNYKFAWRFFPRALARSSQALLVAKEKSPRTIRVIVFGGSAAMGDPEPAYGLPRVLGALLELRYPERDFEIINAAMTAVNSHVVLSIVTDCRDLDAHAWVIYMGNNEVHGPFGAGTVFGDHDTPLWLIRAGLALKRTRIGQLLSDQWSPPSASAPASWGGLEMFLDHQVAHDDPSLSRVYDHFENNLSDILDMAVDRGTPVVISTVVSNLRNGGPFASLHGKNVSEPSRSQWQTLFQRGCAAQAAGEFDQAIEAFTQASRIDAEFAELQFRLGECLLHRGQPDRARERFVRARDFDALRFRADSTINELITSTSLERSEKSVHLIDANSSFARRSPHGIIGEEFLYEHVHLNFAGNYVLAKLFAQQLIGALHLEADGNASDVWPSAQQCADRLGLTPYHRYLILREMRTRLRASPFDQQANCQARAAKLETEIDRLQMALTSDALRTAVAHYQQLLEHDPTDSILRKQFAALLESTGDVQGAIQQWVEITHQLAHHAEGFYKMGTLLNRAKQWNEAEQALGRALALRPAYARARNSLGICLSHLGRFEDSNRQFAEAVALRPNYAEAYVNWGLVLASQGDTEGARGRYLRALQAEPDYLPAHLRLGKQYVAAEQYGDALPHYTAVVRVKPNDPAAQLNLGLLYIKKKQAAEAVHHLEQAVQLDPSNRLARQALAQARHLGRSGP